MKVGGILWLEIWVTCSIALSLGSVLKSPSLEDISNLAKVSVKAEESFANANENDVFSTLNSKIDDSYSLRIKTVDPAVLGVDTVKQWSGYLDYEDSKHFFYWYFESRNDPEKDPIILWLNGGPGCSSFTGLFFELGPSSIGEDIKPVYNPYSWNSNASVIFLDQPIGVGFSYGNEKITTTDQAAKDVYIFLEMFFERFPHLANNTFHIAGESYAGHYLPKIGHEIAVVHKEDASFTLDSVLIGNGFTDPLNQYKYYKPMACGEGGYPAVLQPEDCEEMQNKLPFCLNLVERCYKSKSTFACVLADRYCEQQITGVYSKSGLNVYDIRSKCEVDDESGACYKEEKYISSFLNEDYVQKALGSDVQNFVSCSAEVGIGFALTGDGPSPFYQYISELIDVQIPVLIYAGDKDYICNWLGNEAWTKELDWKLKDEYGNAPTRSWLNSFTGEMSGTAKNYGPLTFLRVYEAGHMVPHDQPENSLDMVNRWIQGDHSFQ